MKPIFISYRRGDAAGHAGRLFDALRGRFPDQVFLDVDALRLGDLWSDELEQNANGCQVFLIVIGKQWLHMQDEESGKRRLDQPEDWVCREIELAFKRTPSPLIVPVLVDGANMPKADYLPAGIQGIPAQQSLSLRHDDHEHGIQQLAARIQPFLKPAPIPPPSTSKYLTKLRQETEFIDIKGLQVGQRKAPRFEISHLYTPLTTVLHTGQNAKPVPLQQALRNPRLVLVGNPGAGKSTFLRRIVFAACTSDRAFLGADPPFPIFLEASSLSDFIDNNASLLPDLDCPEWLPRYLDWKSKAMVWGLPPEFFAAKLQENCLLLVDGLDEAPDRTHRKNLAALLEKAAIAYEQAHIVVTTRPSAYGGETHLAGYHTAEIAPLDDAAIAAFVANWYAGLYPDEPTQAEERGRSLTEAIHGRPEIEEMALNPVMLTALAVLHWSEARLPDQRAELYESVLKWLARARDEKRQPEKRNRASADQCMALMQHLAYTMHAHPKGMQREITPHAAGTALKDRFRDVAAARRLAAARQFLEDEEMDTGILVGRNKKLRFWHRTFQEYLAAKALAGRDRERGELLFGKKGCLYTEEWRETVLLLGALLCDQDASRIDEFLCQMLDEVTKGGLAGKARCVGLIGRMLRDLKAWKYEIADPRYELYLREVLSLFSDPKAARLVDFQTRLEVADALGQVGDPRLAEDQKWVDVGPFRMGRFPVTVQEFAEYVAKGKGTEPGNWPQQLRYPNRPVVSVDWHQAAGYCQWAGGRLPTEAEWEYAARCGREGDIFPWGSDPPDQYKANYLETGPRHVTPVGMYPEGATPNGVQDLAGNVLEWCEDWFDNDENMKLLRGGSFDDYDGYLRVSDRSRVEPDDRHDDIGFRCIRE